MLIIPMGLGLYLGAFLSLQGMMINPTMQGMGANPEGVPNNPSHFLI